MRPGWSGAPGGRGLAEQRDGGRPAGIRKRGSGSSREGYAPGENSFRIHYRKAGQKDHAVAEVRGMSRLEEFYRYT